MLYHIKLLLRLSLFWELLVSEDDEIFLNLRRSVDYFLVTTILKIEPTHAYHTTKPFTNTTAIARQYADKL